MSDHRQTAGKPVLSMKFFIGLERDDPLISCEVGIPGQNGSITKTWGRASRALTEGEHQDLQTWILVTVRHTYLARYGIQSVLHTG